MAYLNLDLDYFDHPKTKRLVGALGRGADLLPIRLWAYTGRYFAETGVWTDSSPTDLENAIGWWGQPGRALEALLRPFQDKPGFLESTESGYKVHDWEKINGHIQALKERAQAAAKARWEKARADAQAMLKHSTSIALGNAPQEEGIEGSSPGSGSEKGKEGRRRRARALKALIPPDFQPTPETLAWCAEHRLPEPDFQVLPFLTYWQGRGESRADWQATFRNWMTSPYRKDRPNAANRQHPGGFESAQQRRDKRLLEIAGRTGAGSAHADHPSLRVGPEGDSLGRGVGYRGPDGND